MALPNQTPSDKDALPDRRKATPRNEELARLIGKEISAVMPTKDCLLYTSDAADE